MSPVARGISTSWNPLSDEEGRTNPNGCFGWVCQYTRPKPDSCAKTAIRNIFHAGTNFKEATQRSVDYESWAEATIEIRGPGAVHQIPVQPQTDDVDEEKAAKIYSECELAFPTQISKQKTVNSKSNSQ